MARGRHAGIPLRSLIRLVAVAIALAVFCAPLAAVTRGLACVAALDRASATEVEASSARALERAPLRLDAPAVNLHAEAALAVRPPVRDVVPRAPLLPSAPPRGPPSQGHLNG